MNKTLVSVCGSGGFACLDVDALVPRTLDYFYDDLHLNEKGAGLVAGHVEDAILKFGLPGRTKGSPG